MKFIICGDIFLDLFIHGNVNRISPEAPIPIFEPLYKNYCLGGAGNVINNLSNLSNNIFPIVTIYNDEYGKKILELLKKKKIKIDPRLIFDDHKTITKTRLCCQNHHLIRIDDEKVVNISKQKENALIKIFEKKIKPYSLVILSDYGKGLLTNDLFETLKRIALKNGNRILVDPRKKNVDPIIYKNVDFITPNLNEIKNFFGVKDYSEKDLIEIGKLLVKKYEIKNVIIKCGEKGIIYVNKDYSKIIKSNKVSVRDVSGAGDTLISVIAYCISKKMNFMDTLITANKCAGFVVSQPGTYPITKKIFKKFLKK